MHILAESKEVKVKKKNVAGCHRVVQKADFG